MRITKEGPKLLGEITEERHVLGELVSWKERAIHHPSQPSPSSPNKGGSYGSMVKGILQKMLPSVPADGN